MAPRPLPAEPEPFEPSLQLARDGHHREAVAGLMRSLGGEALHAQHRAAATQALSRIARLAEAAEDLPGAEQALAEAVKLAPGYADLQHQHGLLLIALGRRAEARAALNRALKINPKFVAARAESALLDAREGRLSEALENLRRLGEETRVEEPRLFRQALASLEQAEWDEAAGLLRQALRLTEPEVEAALDRFHRLIEAGDRAAACVALRETVRRHETYADLHYLLGTTELEDGMLDDALWSLGRALELHPDYHVARVQFARVLEALGDAAQAGEQVALVLERDPGQPQALQLQTHWSRRHRPRRRATVERAHSERQGS